MPGTDVHTVRVLWASGWLFSEITFTYYTHDKIAADQLIRLYNGV